MKAWRVALKDNLIRFRDRNGLLLMLAAPLLIAAIVGAAFGGFGGQNNTAPLTDIPFVVVDDDEGDLGQALVDILRSADLSDLLEPTILSDLAAARALVEAGEMRGVIYIPPEFSASIRDRSRPGAAAPTSTVLLYTDPESAFSPLVLNAVLTQIVNGFDAAAIGGQIGAEQALAHRDQLGPALADLPAALAETITAAMAGRQTGAIRLDTRAAGEAGNRASPLAYFAPAMAIFFLMFSLFDAANSILDEERDGTLARMMSTPTGFADILLGKAGGVFLTGLLQLFLLILASWLIFRLDWGRSAAGLALMAVATVSAAAGLGLLITAFTRDAAQAGVVSAAIALVSAILGGTFIQAQAYPAWLQPLSKLTINRWALDGFTDLTLRRQGFGDILPEAGVLIALAAIYFALAWWRLPRRFVR
jgi:ABC-2 type transport system permease protein